MGKGGYIVSGFGYLTSTNEYKVVRICYPTEKLDYPQSSAAGWVEKLDYPQSSAAGWVQVYTLGNNNNSGWRVVGEITATLWLSGVQANGALHFMDDVNWKIVTLDLESEEIGVLPSPPCFQKFKDPSFQVQVLGGHLYVVHQQSGEYVDIWLFQHNENRDHYERREKDFESWSWSKKFSIEWKHMSIVDYYQPFAITEKNEFLFWIVSYVPVEDQEVVIEDQEVVIQDQEVVIEDQPPPVQVFEDTSAHCENNYEWKDPKDAKKWARE
ncbi:F-box protein At3g07870-like [Papaver somniferum]|uniref:F-box protein At3g07870-like n=1 Tax=Papaver somniferum TaxID=3469 RepID=UPI000E705CF5|nr:F-box protein At3g07870-like [Papaver somniferum]